MNKKTIAKIWLVFAVILWASAFVGIRAGLQGYTPGGLGLLRMLVASLVMGILCLFLKNPTPISLRDKIAITLLGMFAIGCYNITLNYGEMEVPSGVASFIVSQSPVLTILFTSLFLREKITGYIVIGMSVSLIGLAILLLTGDQPFTFQMGFLYLLAATGLSAAYSILQKYFLRHYSAMHVTAYIIWGATLLLLIYLPEMRDSLKTASMAATSSVVYLGVFPAAVGYLAWSFGLRDLSISQAVNFLYLIPLAATLIGWIWLGEVLTWLSFSGGVIVLAGVWLTHHADKMKFNRKLDEQAIKG